MADLIHRVFLCHSSKDKAFVIELHRRLTRDGVSCFLDAESIGWGDNWVKALERAIDSCECIVFILSPDFCNSDGTEAERTGSMADDLTGRKRKMLPLTRQVCDHLPTFPRFLRPIQSIDVSTDALFDKNYPRICRDLGGVPGEDFTFTDRTKLPPVSPLPERFRMPYRSLDGNFISRVQEIWNVYDALYRDRTAVLQGMGIVAGAGGLGKTQLAIEYAYRFAPAYTGGVYWIDADRGLSSFVTQLTCAAGFEVDRKAEEPIQVEQIWRELNKRHTPSLLVLDNFPENVPLHQYVPTTGRIHTVVTTRRQDLGHAVRLKTLSIEEGVRLLNSGDRRFDAAAGALADRLGGLPLALELAKSYLNYRQDVSISALLEEMKNVGEIEALAEFTAQYRNELPSGHARDIVQTFQMSWNVTPDPAREVLRVIGELAPAPVPRSLLREILDWPEESLLRDKLNKSISELVRLSLVELNTAGNPTAHRLILAFVRHRNTLDDASPFDNCTRAVRQQMRRTFGNPDANTLRELESIVPHAEFLLATDRMAREQSSYLLNSLGEHHKTMGRFTAARDAFSAALVSDEKSLEPGHPDIAAAQANLARVLQDLGQLAEARDLLRQALASNEKSFKSGHPSIAILQSNLALVLKDLGQLEEARDLLRHALASDEKLLEPGHPSIATRRSNLALVLMGLGQLEGARDLLRNALASDEKSFKPGHPSIAILQSNLAIVLKDLRQPEKARDLLRQALASNEKSFDPGHPSIARSQTNLAMVLNDLGQLDEARDLLQQAYSSSLEQYGPDFPATKIIKRNLDNLPNS